jgi:4-hydroxy-4-methyl-2-oxoglutarate aldolase
MLSHCIAVARNSRACPRVHVVANARWLSSSSSVLSLLQELRKLDTSSLCDADKALLMRNTQQETPESYVGIDQMNGSIRPMNHLAGYGDNGPIVMAGIARTVQFTERDDFLPVLRGIQEADKDEVLIVNTMYSTLAVAGEMFCAEAQRKELVGIIIDGPVRDTRHLSKYPSVRVYATGTNPYSGTTLSVGKMQPRGKILVTCGGVKVCPGDIVVGDEDGVLVGSVESFRRLVPLAKEVQRMEGEILQGIRSGSKSLASMSNSEDHIKNRLEGRESVLQFRS